MSVCSNVLYAASTFGHLQGFHLPYIEGLRDAGHRVWCVAAGDSSRMPPGVTCVSLPFTKHYASLQNFRVAGQVARLVRAERFDLVLTHTSLAAFFVRLGVVLARKGTTRVVNTVHGYLFDDRSSVLKRSLLLGAERMMAPVTDLVITMNAFDTKIARQYGLSKESPVQVAGMGIDERRFSVADEATKQAARCELGLPQGCFALLCAAEFSQRKHQRFLIEAMPSLPSDVVLLLPGVGNLRDGCRRLAVSLGVADRVIFPGYVALEPWRAATDLCVSASRSEGLPFHVVEALGCGLPAVLSKVKGHVDLVDDGQNGLLYAYDDKAAYIEAVRRLHDNRLLVRAMATRAQGSVAPYGLAAVKPRLLELYGL